MIGSVRSGDLSRTSLLVFLCLLARHFPYKITAAWRLHKSEIVTQGVVTSKPKFLGWRSPGSQVPWQTFASHPKQDLLEGIQKMKRKSERKKETRSRSTSFSSHAIHIVTKKDEKETTKITFQHRLPKKKKEKNGCVSYIRINGQIDV